MHRQPDAPVRVTVVDDHAAVDRVVDALGAMGDTDVTVRSGGDAVSSAVEAGEADCVVCRDPETYETVRRIDPSVVVVVVAPAVDRSTLERIVGDVHAEHLGPDDMLETALPVRLERLLDVDTSASAWRLADFADEAVVEFDLETTVLLEANEQFFDVWGWDRDQFDGATLADLRETDISYELRGQGRGEAGEEELEWLHHDDPVESMVANARGGRFEAREWHYHDGDDGFKTTVRIVTDEPNGRGYLVATAPDEAEADRAVEFDEAAMLQSLLDHIPMAVYFKDVESRHVLVSEDVVQPFIESPEGKIMHTPEDIRLKTEFDLYPAEHAKVAVGDNEQVMSTGEPIRDRIERVQPPNGRELFFSTTKAPWYDSEGRVQGIVGITIDITDEQHRNMALERQSDHVGSVADAIESDLRDPLASAEDHLARYRESGDEADLDAVARSVERAGRLVADVETFARVGRHVDETTWLDASEVAAAVWERLEAGEATLEQDWAYAVRADRDRLARVFEECFENSLSHCGPGVTVRVGTLSDQPGFYVADDGPGISETEYERVFGPGVSATEDRTGYGLAVVREIASVHGWDVSLTDETDGSRLEFTGVPRGE